MSFKLDLKGISICRILQPVQTDQAIAVLILILVVVVVVVVVLVGCTDER